MNAATLRRRLGNNLHRLRTTAKWTQAQAAERADIDTRFYQRCEHGEANATIHTLCKLAKAFDVEPRHLLERYRR